MHRIGIGIISLSLVACVKKVEVAKPPVVEGADLGDGKSQLDTVKFNGVKIEPTMQEDSLTQTEEQVKKDIYNGVEQYWEPLAEIKDLLTVYYDFIEYEYGTDDERNTLYLTEDKKEIFHQLTGSAYDIVVAERNYYEVSAGIYIAGATELRYAEMWNRYPTPEYLDHNAKIVFGESVRDTVQHLMDEGKDKLERLVVHYDKSRVSGTFTEQALQELQWRFPLEYVNPIPAIQSAPLAVFSEYEEVFGLSIFTDVPEWSAIYDEQIQEIQRLSDGQSVVDDIRLICTETLKEYSLLGHAPRNLCVLRQLALQDMLYVRYPGTTLPKAFIESQQVVYSAFQEQVQMIQAWEDTEYGRFWKKEASLQLRELQYEKMKAMRQHRREGELVDLDFSLWDFREPEMMEVSTATILDGHVAQLEREARILIYDIDDIGKLDRGAQMRQLFILIPERLQEIEFQTQACLFAFPEDQMVRQRLELALLEVYGRFLVTLQTYKTSENAKSIEKWEGMIQPFVNGLQVILNEGATFTPEQSQRYEIVNANISAALTPTKTESPK